MIYSPDARQIIIIIIQTVANHYSASDMTSLVSNRSPSFLASFSFSSSLFFPPLCSHQS